MLVEKKTHKKTEKQMGLIHKVMKDMTYSNCLVS